MLGRSTLIPRSSLNIRMPQGAKLASPRLPASITADPNVSGTTQPMAILLCFEITDGVITGAKTPDGVEYRIHMEERDGCKPFYYSMAERARDAAAK
jgi:hypothetical protein